MQNLQKLTEEVRFRERFRGYDYDEVDAYVTEVAEAAAAALLQIEQLKVDDPDNTAGDNDIADTTDEIANDESDQQTTIAGDISQADDPPIDTSQINSSQINTDTKKVLEEAEKTQAEVAQIKETLISALMRAEKTALSVKSEAETDAAEALAGARRQADLIASDARTVATSRIEDATKQAAQIIANANTEAAKVVATAAEQAAKERSKELQAAIQRLANIETTEAEKKQEIETLNLRAQTLREQLQHLWSEFQGMATNLGFNAAANLVPEPEIVPAAAVAQPVVEQPPTPPVTHTEPVAPVEPQPEVTQPVTATEPIPQPDPTSRTRPITSTETQPVVATTHAAEPVRRRQELRTVETLQGEQLQQALESPPVNTTIPVRTIDQSLLSELFEDEEPTAPMFFGQRNNTRANDFVDQLRMTVREGARVPVGADAMSNFFDSDGADDGDPWSGLDK